MPVARQLISLLLSIGLASPALVHAESGYRDEVPAVLQPPPAPPLPGSEESRRFRNSYVAKGRPKIVLYWNRVYEEAMALGWQDQVVVQRSGRTRSMTTTEDSGQDLVSGASSSLSETRDAVDETTTITAGKVRKPDPSRVSPGEAIGWQLEAGYQGALQDAGMRFVDHAAATRQQARGNRSSTPDLQAMETEAISRRADYLLEVLMTPDPDSPTGWSFRIELKGIHTGNVVTSLVSTGVPRASGAQRYIATARGFELYQEPVSIPRVGQELAYQTMQAVAMVW